MTERGLPPGDRTRLAWLAAVGVLVFAVSTALVVGDPAAPWERSMVTAVNDLPDWLFIVVWPPMQLGALPAVLTVVFGSLLTGRRRLALAGVIGAGGAYVGAQVAKDLVDRARPSPSALELREVFEAGSLGFPSGHVTVSTAVVVLVMSQLPRRWRAPAIGLVAVVSFGRMYVGAHYPMDLLEVWPRGRSGTRS